MTAPGGPLINFPNGGNIVKYVMGEYKSIQNGLLYEKVIGKFVHEGGPNLNVYNEVKEADKDMRNGEEIRYYTNGLRHILRWKQLEKREIATRQIYIISVLDGEEEKYDGDKLILKASWCNGELNGDTTLYFRNGNIMSMRKYSMGTLVECLSYHEDGTILREFNKEKNINKYFYGIKVETDYDKQQKLIAVE